MAETATKYAPPLLAFALREIYDISAGDNDLSLYSAAGFPYLFKLCTDYLDLSFIKMTFYLFSENDAQAEIKPPIRKS
jgi:hypothetical protein